ncbi:MAG: hypothetical protein ACR2PL_00895 [Dehalococcoidia bacterium]
MPSPYGYDANGDGLQNGVDALCILRNVAGLSGTSVCPQQFPFHPDSRDDTNDDGLVGAVDALCAMRFTAGLPGTYYCPIFQNGIRVSGGGYAMAGGAPATTSAVAAQATPPPVGPARVRIGSPQPAAAVTPMDSSYLQFSLTPGSVYLSYGQTATFTLQVTIPAGMSLGAWTIDVGFWAPYTTATSCYSSLSACNWSFDSQDVRFANASTSGLSGTVTLGTVTLEDTDVAGYMDPVFVQIRDLADPSGNPLSGGGGSSWINTQ